MPGPAHAAPPLVLLASCTALPTGEELGGSTLLLDALAERGIEGRWSAWDDPGTDWSAGLVALRATWDYEARREEFLAWTRSLPSVLNSAALFAWNTDKAYLVQLAAHGVPVVPTVVVEAGPGLRDAVTEVSPGDRVSAVVKPRVGAGGRGVVVLDGPAGDDASYDVSGLGKGPWIVQPLVDAVRTEGETSVFVLDGEVVAQAQKVPAAGEIRVHEQYGGSTVAVAVTAEAADLARRTVAAAEALLGERLDYARVDQMRLADGTLAVSELEATEPGLYLTVLPGNAAAFADMVAARLHR